MSSTDAATSRADDGAAHETPRVSAWPRSSLPERIIQATVGLCCLAAIGLGLWLTPDPSGAGTHTQLGLPACGMLEATGEPCITCGVTTSFALAAHGRPIDALATQPFGLVCFLLVAGGLVMSVVALLKRASWYPILMRVHAIFFVLILAVILFLSWWYRLTGA